MDNGYLGDKDDLRFTLADAAMGISTDETEANNAGGADLSMATVPICYPLKCLRTDSTAIVHSVSSLFCKTEHIGCDNDNPDSNIM